MMPQHYKGDWWITNTNGGNLLQLLYR